MRCLGGPLGTCHLNTYYMKTTLLRMPLAALGLASFVGPMRAQTEAPVDNTEPSKGEVLELILTALSPASTSSNSCS